MTKPTHTHRTQGGRFEMIAHYNGDVSLEAQMIVVYRDLDREVDTATTAKDWETNWRLISTDDCPVCLGSGHDQIKGNKDRPCGGCFGLGKVRADGETPADLWELADVALGIIQPLRHELELQRQTLELPEVKEAVMAADMRRMTDSIAQQEQQWRDGKGHGPGGRRYTGD